jgi:serine/threonine-protein kinase
VPVHEDNSPTQFDAEDDTSLLHLEWILMGTAAPVRVGRYAIHDRIAAGGMATVHLGRLVGEGGFARTVAIKRLHPHFSLDPDFVSMFLDEARLAARIRHPNVVQTVDVVVANDEVFLVMDYVEGESFSFMIQSLAKVQAYMAPACASAIVSGALRGLHAAHEAKNDAGDPLGIVHRDVSPQNILVGVDGIPRVLDFGVAKALGQSHVTREGQLKGKLAYMAPEQIVGGAIDRRTDIFAAAVVAWEALTGRRLFKAENDVQVMNRVLQGEIPAPSSFAPEISRAVDAVVLRGLSRDPSKRFSTAEEMADALEDAAPPLPTRKVALWAQELIGTRLAARAELVREIEAQSKSGMRASFESSALPRPSSDAIDVTVAEDSPVEAAQQPTSQVSQVSHLSSISLETPSRLSMASPPATQRLLTGALIAAASLCLVGVGVLVARRQADAGGAGAPPSTSIPVPVAAAPPPTVPPPTTTPPPSTSPAPTDTSSAAAAPRPVTSAQPATSASAPAAPATAVARPQPVYHPPPPKPAGSANLYGRF